MVLDKMGVPAALPPRPEQYTSLHGSKIQKQKFPVHLKRSVYIDFREMCASPHGGELQSLHNTISTSKLCCIPLTKRRKFREKCENISSEKFLSKFPGSRAAGAAEHFPTLLLPSYYICVMLVAEYPFLG